MWCLGDHSAYFIPPAQEFWRNPVQRVLVSLFPALLPVFSQTMLYFSLHVYLGYCCVLPSGEKTHP